MSKVHSYGAGKTIRFQVLYILLRFGTLLDKRNTNQLRPSIIDVRFTNSESQIALCVYDITKKESFGVLKNWVDELKNKGP